MCAAVMFCLLGVITEHSGWHIKFSIEMDCKLAQFLCLKVIKGATMQNPKVVVKP
jgi:hypothetical protein